jgi:hypothetical protein
MVKRSWNGTWLHSGETELDEFRELVLHVEWGSRTRSESFAEVRSLNMLRDDTFESSLPFESH